MLRVSPHPCPEEPRTRSTPLPLHAACPDYEMQTAVPAKASVSSAAKQKSATSARVIDPACSSGLRILAEPAVAQQQHQTQAHRAVRLHRGSKNPPRFRDRVSLATNQTDVQPRASDLSTGGSRTTVTNQLCYKSSGALLVGRDPNDRPPQTHSRLQQ